MTAWLLVVGAQVALLASRSLLLPGVATLLFVPWDVPEGTRARVRYFTVTGAFLFLALVLSGQGYAVRAALSAVLAAAGGAHRGPRYAANCGLAVVAVYGWVRLVTVATTPLLVLASWAETLCAPVLFQGALPNRDYAPLLSVWFTMPWVAAVHSLPDAREVMVVVLCSATTWVAPLGKRVDGAAAATVLGLLIGCERLTALPDVLARASLASAVVSLHVLLSASGLRKPPERRPGAAPFEAFPYALLHALAVTALYFT